MQKPIFKKLLQVGFVVKDAEAVAKNYAEKYGIGPWDYYGPGMLSDITMRGKKADFDIKVACGFIGDVEIELIQPLDDQSIYAEHLKQHGEGLHHLAFDTANDHGTTVKFFKDNGVEVLLDAFFGGEEEVTYVDSQRDLACITEFYKRPENVTYPKPTKTIEVPEE